MNEIEAQIIEIIKEKHIKTGGNNGNSFGDFDHILKMPIEERNVFLKRMEEEKKISIREGGNAKMIMMPK